MVMSGCARSSRRLIWAGLFGGTAMASVFVAKGSGCLTVPAWTARSMASDDAAAKTSTGAPAASCSASVELPAKLNRTAMPGLSCSKAAPSAVNESVNEAAAETVMVLVSSLEQAVSHNNAATSTDTARFTQCPR